MKSLRKQGIILFTIFALVLAACGGDTVEEEVVEETAPEVVETLDSPAVTTASTVKTGVGVTSDPCPETVGAFPTGADPNKGCIYLGLLNDYTGPYGALGPALELGQRSFWLWANNAGGVGDYSVAIVEGYDTQYNPQKHLEGYNSQRDSVAALAMSLGTPQTLFILDELDKDNTIAAPMSWWSGYAYKDADKGLIVEFGAAYCAQGMNSVDWALNNLPVDIKTIGIMGFAGDYGGDWASGVAKAAAANGLDVAWSYVPPAPEFDVAQAVGLMVTQPVDAYFPALGPNQMAQVAGGAFQQGLTPIAMMASPSFNDAFVQEGFASVEEVAYVPASELMQIEEFDEDIVEELRNRARDVLLTQAIVAEEIIENAEPAEDLLELKGVTKTLASKLASKGVITREDLAELASDDLIEIHDMEKEKADALIMEARSHWFDEDEK